MANAQAYIARVRLVNFPVIVFFVSLVLLWTAARLGVRYAHRIDQVRDDFTVILTATLTLLGLLVGFTFSMAVGRYDQRKVLEEEEANAIGTEYLRAELLSASDSERIKGLLREYLDQRVAYYQTRDGEALKKIDVTTSQLQGKLWAVVRDAGSAASTPTTALVISGMNDVINSQGYTAAAWTNRIPRAAWWLLALITICGTAMVGLSMRGAQGSGMLVAILPVIVSSALLLIADIDAPRGGLIHVQPDNLMSLAKSLEP